MDGPQDVEDVEAATERLKERIYATITMISVVVGLSASDEVDEVGAAATIATAALGVWLAALVADQQAHHTVAGRLATGRELRRLLHVSSPLLLAAVGPLILVGVAAIGAMPLTTALLTSAVVDIAALFGWGCLGGLRMGGGLPTALIAGVVDAAIGTAVATVKALAGH